VCSHCGGVGHPVESCWKLHPEKRPAQLGAMSAEPSLISELKSMLEESERMIPDIVKDVLIKIQRLLEHLPNFGSSLKLIELLNLNVLVMICI
jgi:hypothetical protein